MSGARLSVSPRRLCAIRLQRENRLTPDFRAHTLPVTSQFNFFFFAIITYLLCLFSRLADQVNSMTRLLRKIMS